MDMRYTDVSVAYVKQTNSKQRKLLFHLKLVSWKSQRNAVSFQ